MTTLSRVDMEGIPFFLQEVDQAGNKVRRVGLRGYPKNTFGGQCPKLSIFKAVSRATKTRLTAPKASKNRQNSTPKNIKNDFCDKLVLQYIPCEHLEF